VRQILIAFVLSLVGLSAQAFEKVQCQGSVSFESGTMQGRMNVSLVQEADGRWILNNHIDAGTNLSSEPDVLELDTYGFVRCKGATVRYDSRSRVLDFRYKYDSGFLGGGCQKTAAAFTDCSHE
jgi:hypothetical protein